MSPKQWVLYNVMEEEQGLQDQFMEGAKVRGDPWHVELSVCEAEDGLVAELGVLGLSCRKWGWINREGKLEAQNKASEDDVMTQRRMLEEFKAQSKMAGAKGPGKRNITFINCMRKKGSRSAWREEVGREKGYCDMLLGNRWWMFYSLKPITLEEHKRMGVTWLNGDACV